MSFPPSPCSTPTPSLRPQDDNLNWTLAVAPSAHPHASALYSDSLRPSISVSTESPGAQPGGPMATRFASGFNPNLNHDESARSQASYHSYDYQVVGSDGAMWGPELSSNEFNNATSVQAAASRLDDPVGHLYPSNQHLCEPLQTNTGSLLRGLESPQGDHTSGIAYDHSLSWPNLNESTHENVAGECRRDESGPSLVGETSSRSFSNAISGYTQGQGNIKYVLLPLLNSGLNQDAIPNANTENPREVTFNLIRADLQSIQLQISCLCQSLKVVEERLQAALKNEH